MADAPVHRVQLAQPHQQQAGAALPFGAAVRPAAARRKWRRWFRPVSASAWACARSSSSCAAWSSNTACSRRTSEFMLRVRRRSSGTARLGREDEAPLLQRLRLGHGGVQRPAPAAQRQRGQRRRSQTQHRQPAGHAQAAGPQRIVRPVGLARQLQRAQRPPSRRTPAPRPARPKQAAAARTSAARRRPAPAIRARRSRCRHCRSRRSRR